MKFPTLTVAATLTLLAASTTAAVVASAAEGSSSSSYVEELKDLSETAALLSSSTFVSQPFFAFCGAPTSSSSSSSSEEAVEGCLAMSERIHSTLGHEFYGDAVLGQVEDQAAQHWQYYNGYLKTTGIFDFQQPKVDEEEEGNSWTAQVQEYCLGLVDTKITKTATATASSYAVRLVECPPAANPGRLSLEEQRQTNDLTSDRHLKWLYKPQTGQIVSLVEVDEGSSEGEDSNYCLTWSSTSESADDTIVMLQQCAAPEPYPTTKHQRQKFVAIGTAEPFVVPLFEKSSEENDGNGVTVEVAYFSGIEDSQPIDLQTSDMSLEVSLEDVTRRDTTTTVNSNSNSNSQEEEEDSVIFKETLDGLDHAGIVSIVDSGDILTSNTVMTVSMNVKTYDYGNGNNNGNELPSSSNSRVVFIATFDNNNNMMQSSDDASKKYSCSSVTGTGILIAFGAIAGLAFFAIIVNMTMCRTYKAAAAASSSDDVVVGMPTTTTNKPSDDDDDGTEVQSVSEASSDDSSMVGV